LESCIFAGVDCRDVQFGKCNLEHTSFNRAILARADLTQAVGLKLGQLLAAENLRDAKLPPDLARDLSTRIANDPPVETLQELEKKERAAEPKPRG
jgi:uncharacterized protein YjbI with pentapeptide repeats